MTAFATYKRAKIASLSKFTWCHNRMSGLLEKYKFTAVLLTCATRMLSFSHIPSFFFSRNFFGYFQSSSVSFYYSVICKQTPRCLQHTANCVALVLRLLHLFMLKKSYLSNYGTLSIGTDPVNEQIHSRSKTKNYNMLALMRNLWTIPREAARLPNLLTPKPTLPLLLLLAALLRVSARRYV